MQIHVLIPIPASTSTGPDPPEVIYHYTTGLKLKQIINSGCIRPTTAKIEPHEKPVAWFSTQDHWEPTCTKVPIPGMQGQIETAKDQDGLVRITVPGTCAPYAFPQLPLIAGTKPNVCIGLLVAGLELGSLIAFAIVTETVFAWPGMGKLLIDSINVLDRPVIVAYLLATVCLFILINLLVDLLYAALDPRVQSGTTR